MQTDGSDVVDVASVRFDTSRSKRLSSAPSLILLVLHKVNKFRNMLDLAATDGLSLFLAEIKNLPDSDAAKVRRGS